MAGDDRDQGGREPGGRAGDGAGRLSGLPDDGFQLPPGPSVGVRTALGATNSGRFPSLAQLKESSAWNPRDLAELEKIITEIEGEESEAIQQAYARISKKLGSLAQEKARINMVVALASQGLWTPLLRHCQLETSSMVLATMARMFQHCPRAPAGEVLYTLLRHPDTRVRSNALDALTYRRDPTQREVALSFLKDRDHRPRAAGILYLYPTDPDSCRKSLLALAWSPERLHRASAAFCLSRLLPRYTELEPLLQDMMLRETDLEVLKAVLTVVVHQGTETWADRLGMAAGAASEPQHAMLEAALEALKKRMAGEPAEAGS